MDFDQYASSLANEPTDVESWQKAMEATWKRVGSAFSTLDNFVDFAKCFSSSAQFTAFVLLIDDDQMQEFLKAVDASDYSLGEWVTALRALDDWLKDKDRDLAMQNRIGYVACCAEAVSVFSPLPPLEDVTHDMVTSHGID